MEQIIRQPKGIPTGGEFAAHDRAEAPDELSADRFRERFAALDAVRTDGRTQAMRVEALMDEAASGLVPAGSVLVIERDWQGLPHFELAAVRLPDGSAAPAATLAKLERLTSFIDDVDAVLVEDWMEEDEDEDQPGGGERRIVRVGNTRLTSSDRARLRAHEASIEAGLGGVMSGVFDALIDRADGDDKLLGRYAALTVEQVTDLYDGMFGPALDEAERYITEGFDAR